MATSHQTFQRGTHMADSITKNVTSPPLAPEEEVPVEPCPEASQASSPRLAESPHLAERSTGAHISDREHVAVLICTDFLATCAAVPLAILLLASISTASTNSVHNFPTNLSNAFLFPLAVIATMAAGGAYRTTHRPLGPSTFKELQDLLFAVGAGCVLTIAIGSVLHASSDFQSPRATQLVIAVGVTVVFVSIGRVIVRTMLHTLTDTRVIIVGSGSLAVRITTYLGLQKGVTLVGRVVDEESDMDEGALGTVHDLPALCQKLSIQRVIVGFPSSQSPETVAVYRQIQTNVHLAFVPRYFELVSWRSRLTDLTGLPLLEVARPDLSSLDRLMKRSFDVALSLLIVIACSPVFLAIALAVRLSSPGGILFRQVRLGKDVQPFTILKFRTMTSVNDQDSDCSLPDADKDFAPRPLFEARQKLSEHQRITPIGRFLRKSSLDELPQVFNVLRGDMSIVGPRPFVPHESDVEGWAARRFEVRPGITGLWQVSGRNQLTADDLKELDYLYVCSWSFWWDLKIIFDTPRTMISGTGAY
jgi:exopolysaccharide biosynthesis polyprenyl glycosylphosphotransferase